MNKPVHFTRHALKKFDDLAEIGFIILEGDRDMSLRMRYDREDDVLMIWFADGLKVDHAEHVGSSILHLTNNGEPILLEILNAQEFVTDLVRTAISAAPGEPAA